MQSETLHGTLLELPDELSVLSEHVTVNNDGTYEKAASGKLVGASLDDVRDRLELVDLDEEAFIICNGPATATARRTTTGATERSLLKIFNQPALQYNLDLTRAQPVFSCKRPVPRNVAHGDLVAVL